jgi:hypothetical protein
MRAGSEGTGMADTIEAFITRWTTPADQGGQERANYVLFLSELTDLLGVRGPIRRGMKPNSTTMCSNAP